MGDPYRSQSVSKYNSYICISRKRAASEVAVELPEPESPIPLEEEDSLAESVQNVHHMVQLMQSNNSLVEKLKEAEIRIEKLEDENANICNTIERLNN